MDHYSHADDAAACLPFETTNAGRSRRVPQQVFDVVFPSTAREKGEKRERDVRERERQRESERERAQRDVANYFR